VAARSPIRWFQTIQFRRPNKCLSRSAAVPPVDFVRQQSYLSFQSVNLRRFKACQQNQRNTMKRLMLALIALTFSIPVAAEWVQFMKWSTGVVYIDSASVRKEGDLRMALVLVDMNQKDADGVQSKLGQSEIDCQELKMRIHDLRGFSGNMATGEAVYAFNGSSNWMPIPPNTVLWDTINRVCSR
jgi:hypothetical protein